MSDKLWYALVMGHVVIVCVVSAMQTIILPALTALGLF